MLHTALPDEKATWEDLVLLTHEPDCGVGLDGENLDEPLLLNSGAQAWVEVSVGRLH